MADAGWRRDAQLEKLGSRPGSLSRLRYLEAMAGAQAGTFARRYGHLGRRHHGRIIRSACVIRGRVFQSLVNMAARKDVNGRPQIAQVTPRAAIAGGEFQIRGKGLAAGPDRPRVTIGDAPAQVTVGSDSFVVVKVPEGAAGDLIVE